MNKNILLTATAVAIVAAMGYAAYTNGSFGDLGEAINNQALSAVSGGVNYLSAVMSMQGLATSTTKAAGTKERRSVIPVITPSGQSIYQAYVEADLFNRDGSPVSGTSSEMFLLIEKNRYSSAGQVVNGHPRVSMPGAKKVTGLYTAKLTRFFADDKGRSRTTTMGQWNSIPVNDGQTTKVTLRIGKKAELVR